MALHELWTPEERQEVGKKKLWKFIPLKHRNESQEKNKIHVWFMKLDKKANEINAVFLAAYCWAMKVVKVSWFSFSFCLDKKKKYL